MHLAAFALTSDIWRRTKRRYPRQRSQVSSAARSPVYETASSSMARVAGRPIRLLRSGAASRAATSSDVEWKAMRPAHIAFAGHGENALRHGAVLRRV